MLFLSPAMWASHWHILCTSHLEVNCLILSSPSSDSHRFGNRVTEFKRVNPSPEYRRSGWLHRHLELGANLHSRTGDLRALTLRLLRLVHLISTTVYYLALVPHLLLRFTTPAALDLWRPFPIPAQSAAPGFMERNRLSLTHRRGWLTILCRLSEIASPSPFGFVRWGTVDLGV